MLRRVPRMSSRLKKARRREPAVGFNLQKSGWRFSRVGGNRVAGFSEKNGPGAWGEARGR